MLHFLKKREYKHAKDKNYRKVRDHCHYNGHYHFIIKELAGQFTSLEENTEKNINVSVPIDKNGKEITRIIS